MTALLIVGLTSGLTNIVETMYHEGIDTAILNDGRTIEVYGNGTYSIN